MKIYYLICIVSLGILLPGNIKGQCIASGANEFCDEVNAFNSGTGPMGDLISFISGVFRVNIVPPLSVNSTAVTAVCDPCFSGSLDPNVKYGLGNGSTDVHRKQKLLSYTIEFENLSTATSPAAVVVVSDTLDPSKFDFSTFKFGSITVGENLLFEFSGGQLKDFTIINLRATRGIDLKIEATFDTVSGIISWYFASLDTVTYDIVDDPALGFLPPNINGAEGLGGVKFFIERKELSSGTPIINRASIIFDSNAPIITPDWLVIVDVTKPSSYVNSLPAVVNDSIINISWSGFDNHAGISRYSVFYSDNDGPYKLLLHTNSQSTTFTGQFGHKYKFYSKAIDRAGNIEDTPEFADSLPDTYTYIYHPLFVDLKLYIDGYYIGGGIMQSAIEPFGTNLNCDTIKLELANREAPHLIVGSDTSVMDIYGNARFEFRGVRPGEYYLVFKHRNTIETWSASYLNMNDTVAYDFTLSKSMAYGDNQAETFDFSGWAIYSGDISDVLLGVGHQDGVIESSDYSDMENALYYTLTGYIVEDITGDGVVESSDYSLMENSLYYSIIVMRP